MRSRTEVTITRPAFPRINWRRLVVALVITLLAAWMLGFTVGLIVRFAVAPLMSGAGR
jgi:hypothetical protein